jgi:hypothetical protein
MLLALLEISLNLDTNSLNSKYQDINSSYFDQFHENFATRGGSLTGPKILHRAIANLGYLVTIAGALLPPVHSLRVQYLRMLLILGRPRAQPRHQD